MSRRHYHEHTAPAGHDHTIPSNLPFRENLVFYAPLANEICNCDYVSGTVPITDTNNGSTTEFGSAQWDSTEGAWLLYSRKNSMGGNGTMPTSLRYLDLTLYTGEGTDNITSKGLTMFFIVKDVERYGNCYETYLSPDDPKIACPSCINNSQGLGGNAIENGRMMVACNSYNFNLQAVNNSTRLYQPDWTKCACTVAGNGDIKFYRAGLQKRTANWASNIKGNPTSIGLVYPVNNNQWLKCYMKDVRVYNRVLTQAEIQTL